MNIFAAEENYIAKTCIQKDVLHSLTEGNLNEFDPLVGDTCCQIRALAISLIYKKISESGVESLTEDEKQFLILSKFLTQTKDIVRDPRGKVISETVNHKKITGEVTSKKGRVLLIDAQRKLAQLSVNLVQELAKKQSDKELEKALQYVLLDEDSHFKRPHCAYYPITKLILDTSLSHKIPILIKISRLHDTTEPVLKIFYKPENGVFLPIEGSELKDKDNIIVIEGFSDDETINNADLRDKFVKLGVYNIILATCATHPQFTGQKKHLDVPYQSCDAYSCPNLVAAKNDHILFSKTHGCWSENKKLFFLDHVYVTTYKDIK